jgi:hypothetical protein
MIWMNSELLSSLLYIAAAVAAAVGVCIGGGGGGVSCGGCGGGGGSGIYKNEDSNSEFIKITQEFMRVKKNLLLQSIYSVLFLCKGYSRKVGGNFLEYFCERSRYFILYCDHHLSL